MEEEIIDEEEALVQEIRLVLTPKLSLLTNRIRQNYHLAPSPSPLTLSLSPFYTEFDIFQLSIVFP